LDPSDHSRFFPPNRVSFFSSSFPVFDVSSFCRFFFFSFGIFRAASLHSRLLPSAPFSNPPTPPLSLRPARILLTDRQLCQLPDVFWGQEVLSLSRLPFFFAIPISFRLRSALPFFFFCPAFSTAVMSQRCVFFLFWFFFFFWVLFLGSFTMLRPIPLSSFCFFYKGVPLSPPLLFFGFRLCFGVVDVPPPQRRVARPVPRQDTSWFFFFLCWKGALPS